MESILPYLIWGGLFFLMMRFGCGSHLFRQRSDQPDQSHGDGHGCCGPARGQAPEIETPPERALPPAARPEPFEVDGEPAPARLPRRSPVPSIPLARRTAPGDRLLPIDRTIP